MHNEQFPEIYKVINILKSLELYDSYLINFMETRHIIVSFLLHILGWWKSWTGESIFFYVKQMILFHGLFYELANNVFILCQSN